MKISKQQTKAMIGLAKASEINPEGVKAAESLFVCYVELGIKQVNKGDLEEAVKSLKKAQNIYPENECVIESLSIIHSKIGRDEYNKGNFREAVLSLEKALEVNPKNVKAKENLSMSYSNIGVKQCEEGDFKAGTESFKKALEINPKNVKAKENLSVSYSNIGVKQCEEGDFKAGTESFKKALEINPENATVKENLFFLCSEKPDIGLIFLNLPKVFKNHPEYLSMVSPKSAEATPVVYIVLESADSIGSEGVVCSDLIGSMLSYKTLVDNTPTIEEAQGVWIPYQVGAMGDTPGPEGVDEWTW